MIESISISLRIKILKSNPIIQEERLVSREIGNKKSNTIKLEWNCIPKIWNTIKLELRNKIKTIDYILE